MIWWISLVIGWFRGVATTMQFEVISLCLPYRRKKEGLVWERNFGHGARTRLGDLSKICGIAPLVLMLAVCSRVILGSLRYNSPRGSATADILHDMRGHSSVCTAFSFTSDKNNGPSCTSLNRRF